MSDPLIIRADASHQMGVGHLMRCIALAEACQARGGQVIFLSHCKQDGLRRRIEATGIPFVPLNASHPHPLDLRTTLSLAQTCAQKSASPWIVLDGYHLDPAYQQSIQLAGYRLLVIDDMAHQPQYFTDILLNQNLGAEQLTYPCSPDTQKLLGAQYILLRSEFLSQTPRQRSFPNTASKVLVTLGGGDPDHVTRKVIRALKHLGRPDLEVRAIVGPTNPNMAQIRQAAKRLPCPVEPLQSAPDMSKHMAWADVAISASGSTCWEMAFMGLPALLIVLAENQRLIAEHLHAKGAVIHLGWHENLSPREIAEALKTLLSSATARQQMSQVGKTLVDGKGADRVLFTMQGYHAQVEAGT